MNEIPYLLSSSTNTQDGTLFQSLGQIYTESVNFSRCNSLRGSAFRFYFLSEQMNPTQIKYSFIDTCHATLYSIALFELLSASIISSNFINNTQQYPTYGIIYIYGNTYNNKLNIEDCILDKNCKNGNGAYFSTDGDAYIYIFRTTSDSKSTHKGGREILMSKMETNSFENNFSLNKSLNCYIEFGNNIHVSKINYYTISFTCINFPVLLLNK